MKKLLLISLLFIASSVRAQTEPTTFTYRYGLPSTGVSNTGLSGVTNEVIGLTLQKWNTTPGNKVITKVSGAVTNDGAGNSLGMDFVLVKFDGTYYSVDTAYTLTSSPGTGATRVVSYDGLSIPVNIQSGYTYFIGLAFKCDTARASNTPQLRQSVTYSVHQQYVDESETFALFGYVYPSTWTNTVDSNVKAHSTYSRILCMQIEYTSPNMLEYDSGANYYTSDPSTFTLLIPVSISTRTFIKFSDVYVKKSDSLTIHQVTYADSGSNFTYKSTMTVNMIGTDSMIFGSTSASVNLKFIDGYSQANSTYDLAIDYDLTNSKGRMFWLNKLKGEGPQSSPANRYMDIATISHGALMSSSYGYDYAIDPFYALIVSSVSSTRQIGRIQVGVRPLVMMGDSQTGTKVSSTTLAIFQKLGSNLPSSFTHERIPWLAAIGGGRIAKDTTGAISNLGIRYKSTPGHNDLCDMNGVFVFDGIGVNDLKYAVNWEDSKRIMFSAISTMSFIVSDVLSRGSDVYIIGLPPYPDAMYDYRSTETLKAFNYALAGLAMAARVPYVNPYYWAGPYISSDGTHYDDTLVSYVTRRMAKLLENDKQWRPASEVGQTKKYNFNGSAEGQSYRFLP